MPSVHPVQQIETLNDYVKGGYFRDYPAYLGFNEQAYAHVLSLDPFDYELYGKKRRQRGPPLYGIYAIRALQTIEQAGIGRDVLAVVEAEAGLVGGLIYDVDKLNALAEQVAAPVSFSLVESNLGVK
jgi:hypothetical protein